MANGGIVVATVTDVTTHFEQVVRDKLLANKVAGVKPDSIRSLARVMARGNESAADTFKRSLFKWMASSGPNPSVASRALVADALRIDPAELVSEDDEEDSQAMGTTNVLEALYQQLGAALGKSHGTVRELA